jgi:hypothetical protein
LDTRCISRGVPARRPKTILRAAMSNLRPGQPGSRPQAAWLVPAHRYPSWRADDHGSRPRGHRIARTPRPRLRSARSAFRARRSDRGPSRVSVPNHPTDVRDPARRHSGCDRLVAEFAEGSPGVLVVEATGIRGISSGPLPPHRYDWF